jgi:hypothetical protein
MPFGAFERCFVYCFEAGFSPTDLGPLVADFRINTISKLMDSKFFQRFLLSLVFLFPLLQNHLSAQIAAFPGAEGFGATASGGRGGQVVFVTNTNVSGPGSFQAALDVPGPKYILFRCSGVIDGSVEIPVGSRDITIAGQTSPNGIVVRGLSSYNDAGHSTDNLIVRHLRSRCSNDSLHPTTNWVTGDGITLGGVHKAVIDHCSFGQNVDEAFDISRSSSISVQNCLLAETLGEHNYLGGMLTNYTASGNVLDSLSIHHNTWSRIGGRLPEFSCEGPECDGHTSHAEVACNLYHDQGYEIYYNNSITQGGSGPYTYYVDLNFVNNYALAKPSYCNGFFYFDFLNIANNDLFVSGNKMNVYPNWQDYELFSCCNDFCQTGPNTDPGVANHLGARHGYPAITYTATNQVQQYMVGNVGAFPRDAQDQRLVGYLANSTFLPIATSVPGADDPFTIPNSTTGVQADADDDGMPDYWETLQGLNPNVADHNGTNLSVAITGVAGYTNLECYLNCLADALVNGGSPACGISVGIGETATAAAAFQVNPNPTNGVVELGFARGLKGTVTVLDLQGKVLREVATDGHRGLRLDLSSLPAGVYLVKFNDTVKRLVKN